MSATRLIHHTKLKPGEKNVLCLPKFKAFMTGVSMISQDNTGAITLTYTDGERESARPDPVPDIAQIHDAFVLIGVVQHCARKGQRA